MLTWTKSYLTRTSIKPLLWSSLFFCNRTSLDSKNLKFNWNFKISIHPAKRVRVLSDKKKGLILTLLAKGYSAPKFRRTRSSSRHWRQQSYRLAEGESDSPLTRMISQMSLSNHKMTSRDTQKEQQMVAGVNYKARTVKNRLLRAELKSCKDRKKIP